MGHVSFVQLILVMERETGDGSEHGLNIIRNLVLLMKQKSENYIFPKFVCVLNRCMLPL